MEIIDIVRSSTQVTVVLTVGDDLIDLPDYVADRLEVSADRIAEATITGFRYTGGNVHLVLDVIERF